MGEKRTLAVALAAMAVGIMLVPSTAEGGTVTPPSPAWPGAFAPFASLLQANRGGAKPLQITDLTTASSPGVEVTDTAGAYTAFLSPVTLPAPDNTTVLDLHQLDQGSDKSTSWWIDPTTGAVVSGPRHSKYRRKEVKIIPAGEPGALTYDDLTPEQQKLVPPSWREKPPNAATPDGTPVDVCWLAAEDPVLSKFPNGYWYLEAWSVVDKCTYKTDLILGSVLEQVAINDTWHKVGIEATTGAVSNFLLDEAVQPCLGQNPAASWPYSTFATMLGEFDGGIGSGNDRSGDPWQPCQDVSLWTN